ncbi:MAG: AzlC family ABC transporter permease [Actinomycetia bacterium]|nr:AzlC family ABC transporter permease [Actinomycetes bacterium]
MRLPLKATSIKELRHDAGLRQVFAACVTLGMAVGVFAVSFGVAAVGAGASVAQTCVMSLLVFTGASQFSAVSVLGAGGSSASAFGGAALLAARNSVYGLAMAPHLKGRVATRLVAAHITIDESTAMAAAQEDETHRRAAFWITGLSIYLFWNIGTLIGAILGSAIDPKTYGLDAAFPAAFVAMVWPLLRERRSAMAAAIGASLCLALIPFTPVGVPILCAVLGVVVGIPSPRLSHRPEAAQ